MVSADIYPSLGRWWFAFRILPVPFSLNAVRVVIPHKPCAAVWFEFPMTKETSDVPLPTHRYVPGFSPRHHDQWFDEIKASVTAKTPIEQLHQTLAFRAGRAYYAQGYYWECHEVLDVVWVQTKDPSAERDLVLAMIQLANARLKILMNQPRPAWRLCDIVETRLSRCPKDRAILGVHASDMQSLVSEARVAAKDAM